MAKYQIFTVGLSLPGDAFEHVSFFSDQTLLDADIILFEPGLHIGHAFDSYNGLPSLGEHASFHTKRHLDHWRSEIVTAVNNGKIVIVYAATPEEAYRKTGEKQYSGTGRNARVTNIVTQISSYEAVPSLDKVTPKSGTSIRLTKDAIHLKPYWSEVSEYSPYEALIEGKFSRVLLTSAVGGHVVGAAIHTGAGALFFLPPIRYDQEKFVRHDKEKDAHFWTKDAIQFGKRLAAALASLADAIKSETSLTPTPTWAQEPNYRLESESKIESEITIITAEIATREARRAELETGLRKAGTLRGLLFEQGKPLEDAIIQALRLMGFTAEPFANGESEFDAVFVSPEGRCLGEAEGKDKKAINIDKMSQLERNIQEDFARDEVTEYAKGVLFGNAHRLLPIASRGDFFTAKCITAAQRLGAALARTPDMFLPAKYLKEHPNDAAYATECREAIFGAKGDVIEFPAPPSAVAEEISAEQPTT